MAADPDWPHLLPQKLVHPSRGSSRQDACGWPASPRCAAGRFLVVTTRREPSGLKVADFMLCRSGLSSRASVRPVAISTNPRTLLASWTTPSRPSGEKQEKKLPSICLTSRHVPTSHSRHDGLRGHQPSPIGAETDTAPSIDGQFGHLGHRPEVSRSTRRHSGGCGRQPLAIGAN